VVSLEVTAGRTVDHNDGDGIRKCFDFDGSGLYVMFFVPKYEIRKKLIAEKRRDRSS
jgi:hypothetical protein